MEPSVSKYSNQPYRAKSHLGQKALREKRNYEEAKEKMGETIEDADKDNELGDNKNRFLADEMKISYETIMKQMGKIHLTEIFDKTGRVLKKMIETLEKHRLLGVCNRNIRGKIVLRNLQSSKNINIYKDKSVKNIVAFVMLLFPEAYEKHLH